jgi:hypothetical protein
MPSARLGVDTQTIDNTSCDAFEQRLVSAMYRQTTVQPSS